VNIKPGKIDVIILFCKKAVKSLSRRRGGTTSQFLREKGRTKEQLNKKLHLETSTSCTWVLT
jgi:hypothetical protein